MNHKYLYTNHLEAARARFESKYQIDTTGCWQWKGFRDRDGYGGFTLNPPGQKYTLLAHRVSWILSNRQDWPADKPVARHQCDNPSCVNPNHITPGTHKENTLDAIRAGTHFRGTNARKRPVNTPSGWFESGAEAARTIGIRHPALITLLKTPGSGYTYAD